MIRAIVELLVTIFLVMVARSILTGLFKGMSGGMASQMGQRQNPQAPPAPPPIAASALHKDPVCGTYVPESTRYQRTAGAQTFYYCSEDCRERHALAAK